MTTIAALASLDGKLLGRTARESRGKARLGLRGALGLALLAGASELAFAAPQGPTTRASVQSSGAQANHQSRRASISPDGRFVAFASYASDLVPNDTNGVWDVFVHDRETGETSRVSVRSTGAQANGASTAPSLSSDGRYVAFESSATNLVAGDTNGQDDVFIHDRETGETRRTSVASGGAQALGGDSRRPSLSADGRWVSFDSLASNLVPGDANLHRDVFVHDLVAGETTRVSVSSSGEEADNSSSSASISADGRCVAFASEANNLVPGAAFPDVCSFVHDRQLGETTLVSRNAAGTPGLGRLPWISADGLLVTFHGESPNLVPDDTNLRSDVFVHDRQLGETTRVSVDSNGGEGSANSYLSSISPDGRYVAFQSYAPDLVPGDTNFVSDAFVHDRLTGETRRASVDTGGVEGNDDSMRPVISSEGRFVAFESTASNLVPGDTNVQWDVFVKDREPCQGGASSYCTTSSNSVGPGALIAHSGSTSVGANDFVLSASGCPPGMPGLFYYGAQPAQVPFGDGFRCIAGATFRLYPAQQADPSGNFLRPLDLTLPPASSGPGEITPGSTWYFQLWYRDPAGPGGSGFNLSDALAADFCQ